MAARKRKVKHDEKTKDAIRATQLVNFLTNAALVKKKGKSVNPARIAAAKAVLPFLKPQLSSVEQTIHDPKDTLDPVEIEAKLKALYDSRPELFTFLRGEGATNRTAADDISTDTPTGSRVTH